MDTKLKTFWTIDEWTPECSRYLSCWFHDPDQARKEFFKRYAILERLVLECRKAKEPIQLLTGVAINKTFHIEAIRSRQSYSPGSQTEVIRVRRVCQKINSGEVATHGADWIYFTEHFSDI